MRVLFFVDRPGVLRQFASLVTELAARGHDVHLALRSEPDEDQQPQVERLVGASPHVTSGPAPARDQRDGWRPVAWAVRALGDLARYAHPRYANAPTLRARVTGKVVRRFERATELEPIGRRLGLRLARRLAAGDAQLADSVIRTTARLERAIPTSPAIDRYVREQQPDVVLATSVVKLASPQVEFLKSARALGIPAATLVASWDNLTNKGLLKWQPEQVFVWNEIQRREAIELHGMPPDRVAATGAQALRHLVRAAARAARGTTSSAPRPRSRAPVRPLPRLQPVRDQPLRRGGALRRAVDPGAARVTGRARPRRERASCARTRSARAGATPTSRASKTPWSGRATRSDRSPPRSTTRFFDSLAHSAAVVGINTTAMIEAAIVGKSVLTVLAPEFAQESTLHFHYLLEENGGFLHVASVARRARGAARPGPRRTATRTPSSAAASSSRSSGRTGSTGRRRRSSPTRSRSWRRLGSPPRGTRACSVHCSRSRLL